MPQDYAGETLRGCPFKSGEDLKGKNFSKAIVRGVNFEGLDLTGANFFDADIRGANFTKAILKDANFTKAKAGLQYYWVLFLIAISCLLIVFSGFSFWAAKEDNLLLTRTLLVIMGLIVIFFVLPIEGSTGRLKAAITIVAMTGAAIVFLVQSGIGNVVVILVAGIFATIPMIAAGAQVGTLFTVAAVALIGVFGIGVLTSIGVKADAVSLAGFVILSSIVISWRTLAGDQRFTFWGLIPSIAIDLAASVGTSFQAADLTKANFSQARLSNTDFRKANVTHTCWLDAQQLDWAYVHGSILTDLAVRDLVVNRNGENKSFVGLNFKGANLAKVNFTGANLTEADISGATLEGAYLDRANLTKTQALGANFNQAILTGACLEAWNIDSTTQLDGAICEYIYLLNNQRERRPSTGEFAPGEFTKLFQEVLSTVDLIFRNGIDWKAFTYSFNKLIVDNEGTELLIQSLENKGDGVVVVRVNAPPEADKAKIHREFNQNYEVALKALEAKYQAQLEAKDEQIRIYRQQSADMMLIAKELAAKPFSVEVNMNKSTDKSRKIQIGDVEGDFHASGAALNLGKISGTVTNTINQLQSSDNPEAPQLAALLTQLQSVIQTESELKPEDKEEALEQVKALAEVGQNPQGEATQKLARTAMKILRDTASALPSATSLVEACNKLLFMITKLLGLG